MPSARSWRRVPHILGGPQPLGNQACHVLVHRYRNKSFRIFDTVPHFSTVVLNIHDLLRIRANHDVPYPGHLALSGTMVLRRGPEDEGGCVAYW